MQTQSLKQEIMDSFQHLPDDVDIDEVMYRLYVLEKVRKSREAIKQGQVISHNDLKHEIDQW